MDKLPVNGTGKRFVPYLIGTGFFLAVCAAWLIGYWLGLADQKPAAPAAPAAMSAAPLLSCDGPEAVKARNAAWAIMNSLNEGEVKPGSLDAPLATIAAIVAVLIKPETSNKTRAEGIELYRKKGLVFFEEAETATLVKKLFEGPPEERVRQFGYMNLAELEAAQFIHCLLLDKERIAQYLAGEEIAPEGEDEENVPDAGTK